MDNLTDIGTIKSLLSRYGFNFSKGLGQNFLINPAVCPKMAQLSGAAEGVGILEIGPGIGVLTRELCKLSPKVVAVELDKRLIPILKETLAPRENVNIVNGDIMKMDLKQLIGEEFRGLRVAVCANLPYYITSPVIMKLLEEELPLESVTVMVQKEAAQRICAPVGSRQSGALTVAVNFYSTPEMLFPVSSGSFMPAPKVDSSVIRLNLHSPLLSPEKRKSFFRAVKASFAQRRKTLLNSLSSGLGMEKQAVSDMLADCGVNPQLRAEQLSMEDFYAIAERI